MNYVPARLRYACPLERPAPPRGPSAVLMALVMVAGLLAGLIAGVQP